MAIIAASVEASGWVLRLDVSGSLGSFASYALDPDGNPKVILGTSHPGFVQSGGQAVAGTIARRLVATKPLRLPVNPASPTTPVIDESDLGGGVIRVRIALSEHVYATDTALSLGVATGWRSGEAAAAGVVVTNNSLCVAPIPIMRWALMPYGVTAGSFTLAIMVASHHPVGMQPVAAVKFTVTDGTTVKTVWTTALATDASYGDGLRCYTASVDPATATALTAGLLRCDAEVYPWLGAMRTTDAAGTRSMATLRTDGFAVNAASPWVIGYDPAGSRYGQQFAYVDPVNGTVTAAAGMVATSLAGARAVAPGSRPRDVNTAIQAGYLANRTLPAANGQTAQTRSVDGMQIVLAAGTHAVGSTAVTTGIATAEIPLTIVGDPGDADARANCVLPTGASLVSRVTRVLFQSMTLEIGVNSLSAQAFMMMDRVTVRGRAGNESSTTAPFTAAPAAGLYNLVLVRTRWWKTASTIGGGNSRPGLVRACEHSRSVSGALIAVRNRLIPAAEDGFTGSTVFGAFIGWTNPTIAGQAEDIVLAWNDIRSLRGRAFGPPSLPAATAGTPNPSYRRLAFIGNICERTGNDPQPFYSYGEDLSATMSYNIIEGNSFIGDRSNSFYSDPLPTTAAETNSLLNQAYVNRIANNAFDWLPTKHDDFNDPQSATQRGTATGYRPHMIEAWSMLYGVGHEGNVDTRRATAAAPANFALEYAGARNLTGYSGSFSPLYANDQSVLAGGNGGGDYRPQAASPLVGRGQRGNYDMDYGGQARSVPFAAGAYQAPADAAALIPAAARSSQAAGAAMLAVTVLLSPVGSVVAQRAGPSAIVPMIAPARATSATRAGATLLGWAGGLAPASAMLMHRATTSQFGAALPLSPASAAGAIGSTPASIVGGMAALVPSGGGHPLLSLMPLLLSGFAPANATLFVGPDARMLFPNRN